MKNDEEELKKLYIRLFKGREDVYATRWENNKDSGYRPAYIVDWKSYNKHKAHGGSFKSFKGKEYAPLTRKVYESHWDGSEFIGIYPLLIDNTSYFIAADFDKADWKDKILQFSNVCKKYDLFHLIEKSRSGNGGHLWIFFDAPYLASKSRAIVFELLRKAGVISEFTKDGSFDRLFPSQDSHTGSGLGNLIAIPLHGKHLPKGKTCFLESENLDLPEDQWRVLKSVKKNSIQKLDQVFESLFGKKAAIRLEKALKKSSSRIVIVLKNQVFLIRKSLPPKLILFIREKLNFANADYIIKKKMGRSTYKTEPFFKLVEETEDQVLLPRGFAGELVSFCRKEGIDYEIDDQRIKHDEIDFKVEIDLYPYQQEVVDKVSKKDFGVIVAPPGSGKTIISLSIAASHRQPTLIIVHRKQLLDQWIDRIEAFLKIPAHKIGKIASGKKKIGEKITVAMIQSLKKVSEDEKYSNAFGLIIVDECHHIPAKTFRETIIHFSSFFLYGVTATPKRKNNDEKLIFVYIGRIIKKVDSNQVPHLSSELELVIKTTNLDVPFNYQTDVFEVVSNVLVFDTGRNKMIYTDVKALIIDKGRNILILSERKAHLEVLNLYLQEKFETIIITGEDSESGRKIKLEQIALGHFQVVLSTGQYLGEGVDMPNFDCLMMVYPFAFEGKLIQYIGRVHRSKNPPIIIDYRDEKVDYFERLFKKRKTYYNKLRKKGMLIDSSS